MTSGQAERVLQKYMDEDNAVTAVSNAEIHGKEFVSFKTDDGDVLTIVIKAERERATEMMGYSIAIV